MDFDWNGKRKLKSTFSSCNIIFSLLDKDGPCFSMRQVVQWQERPFREETLHLEFLFNGGLHALLWHLLACNTDAVTWYLILPPHCDSKILMLCFHKVFSPLECTIACISGIVMEKYRCTAQYWCCQRASILANV